MKNKQNNTIDSIEKIKNEYKKGYRTRAIFFCVFLALINFILCSFVYKSFGIEAAMISLATLVLVVPTAYYFLLLLFLKKEKLLKVIDFIDDSYPYLLNFLLVLAIYISYSQQESTIEDLNTVISLYSVAWAIFGTSVATLGIWISVNSFFFSNEEKSEKLSSFKFKRFSVIGFVFISISLLINIILLLTAVSYLSNGTALLKYSFFVAIIYVSAHTVLDVIIFIFTPAVAQMCRNISKTDPNVIETCNQLIALKNEADQLKKAAENLQSIKESLEKVKAEAEQKDTIPVLEKPKKKRTRKKPEVKETQKNDQNV